MPKMTPWIDTTLPLEHAFAFMQEHVGFEQLDEQSFSDTQRMLGSLASMSRANYAHYIPLDGEAVSINLNSQHESRVDVAVTQDGQRGLDESGLVMRVPVYKQDGELKGVLLLEKIRFRESEQDSYIMEDGVPVGDAAFAPEALGAVDVMLEHFSPCLGGDEPDAMAAKRDALQGHADASCLVRKEIYNALRAPVHGYYNRSCATPDEIEALGLGASHEQEDSELTRHVNGVAELLERMLRVMQQDQDGLFKDVVLTDAQIETAVALARVHDIGKMHAHEDELKWFNEVFDRPFLGEALARNGRHPLHSFICLNLPGLEKDALAVAQHHGGREPFPDGKVFRISELLNIADVFEAVSGERSVYGRRERNSGAGALSVLWALANHETLGAEYNSQLIQYFVEKGVFGAFHQERLPLNEQNTVGVVTGTQNDSVMPFVAKNAWEGKVGEAEISRMTLDDVRQHILDAELLSEAGGETSRIFQADKAIYIKGGE